VAGGQTPKGKTSRSRTRSRRSANTRAVSPTITQCTRCGESTLPHTACPHCGWYRGREYPEAVRAS
jgi:large subunit ribosomal protein L32